MRFGFDREERRGGGTDYGAEPLAHANWESAEAIGHVVGRHVRVLVAAHDPWLIAVVVFDVEGGDVVEGVVVFGCLVDTYLRQFY
jgi:hypothetical protein